MRSKRRDNNMIVLQILEIRLQPAGKTRIVYQANLNSLKAGQYLENLIERGYIERLSTGSRVLYRTTPTGVELRKRLQKLQSDMEGIHSGLFSISGQRPSALGDMA
ncbi:MAG: winged helix-turn-helix domain-containing protein [Methanothrix sp.]|nr:winged helix-turn-helix domain-containing protein [Methanothrix sp.]